MSNFRSKVLSYSPAPPVASAPFMLIVSQSVLRTSSVTQVLGSKSCEPI
jgi:hypothetical protein